jgi:hypothetical protein
MFHQQGCHGHVVVGPLPDDVRARLAALPGEWLEYDAPSGAIVVHHIQPTRGPSLPTIAHELVRMLSEIPVERHQAILGGELHVHTEDSPHVVRLRVERGGSVRIDWAHPRFAETRGQLYTDGREIPIDPVFCRLNGQVTFAVTDPVRVAHAIQRLADTYEGLYPEGDFRAQADTASGTVRVEMRDVNLDARLLVRQMTRHAAAGSLSGSMEVSSFDERYPDELVQLVFRDGAIWVQEPRLFDETANAS